MSSAGNQSRQVIWALGDYSVIGSTLQIVAEDLCASVGLQGQERIADIACGSGNVAIAAASRGCDVIGIDYAAPLLQVARSRADTLGGHASFVLADAESLPFSDASFDVVLSTFGVMFSVNHRKASAEMLRICKHGGVIGMANWTPESVFGQSSKITARFISPNPNVPSPALWGTMDHLNELFGGALLLTGRKRSVMYRYESTKQYLHTLRTTYPPTINVFAKLSESQQSSYSDVLYELYDSRNEARDGTFLMAMEYLEAVGRKTS